MGGFPLINGFAIAVLLAVLLLPLTSLTGRETRVDLPEEIREEAGTPASERPAWANARFVHQPKSFVVRHLDRVLVTVDPVESNELSVELSLPEFDPSEGIELVLEVQWPESTPETAMELTLEPESLEGRSCTVWGTDHSVEVATFVWPGELP